MAEQPITPPPDLGDALRSAMRGVPTGVALLTVGPAARAAALVVNSVVSVSLSPTLVLVSVHSRSRVLTRVRAERRFGLSFLTSHQQWVAECFAGPDRPTGTRAVTLLGGGTGMLGVPLLAGALATVECAWDSAHPAGDHQLLIGRATAVHADGSDAEPLIFHRRGYTTVAPQPAVRP